MYQSEQIDQLATALAKAQGEFTPAIKDAANPFFKSKYANLCSVYKSCQEPLSKNGLSISQPTMRDENGQWILVTKLLHSSGQWMSSHTPIITAKADIQAFGSAVTYARRYALSALVGVVTDEDDDGEAAMDRNPSPAQQKYEKKQQQKQDVKQLYITELQGQELTKLLIQTDQEYQNTVWNFLNSQGIMSYEEMPQNLYETVKKRIESKLKEKNAD